MFEKSRKYIEKKAIRTGLVLALLGSSAVILSSCDAFSEDATKGVCAVYNTSGQQIDPQSYPLVETTVKFKKPDGGLFNTQVAPFISEKVPVMEIDDGYVLEIGNFPNLPGNFEDQTNPSWPTSVAVQVQMPTEGTLGVTRGCISRGFNKLGFPVGVVHLPANQTKSS